MDAEADILAYRDGFAQHSHVASTLLHERRSGHAVVITIAIPTYRRLALLKQALASAAAQRTDVSFEILVVDNDHESDGRETIGHLQTLDTPDLRYFRNVQNIGMFGNWNRCLTLARGEWITILNDDDLLDTEYLAQCLHYIDLCPSIDMIGCGALIRDERSVPYSGVLHRIRGAINGWRERRRAGKLVRLRAVHYFLHNPHYGSLGIFMRTVRARKLGGFDPKKFPSADYFFFSALAVTSDAFFINAPLTTYRVLQNESKNAIVAVGWIEQGLQLRRQLASRMAKPYWLVNGYANLMAIQTARYSKAYWGSDIDVSQVLRRLGLVNVPVYALLLVWRALLQVWPDGETRNSR